MSSVYAMMPPARRFRRLRRLAALAAVSAAFAPAGPARGQTLVGRVRDDLTGAPVATARVLLVDSLAAAVAWGESDVDGRFVLVAPGAGVFRVYADRLGYDEMISDTFRLGDTGPVELELRMAPLPVELDPLEVTVLRRQTKLERQGFYRRQAYSVGYFFDAADLERWRPTVLSDLLLRVPGVDVRRDRRGGTVLLSRRVRQHWGGPCPMKIVLDGFTLVEPEGGFDGVIDRDRVIGVEVYPGAGGMGAPVELRGTDAYCGIVMVWTR